jgi:endonuclease/exonuclease/phosphatase family metal-dependent hydrolase
VAQRKSMSRSSRGKGENGGSDGKSRKGGPRRITRSIAKAARKRVNATADAARGQAARVRDLSDSARSALQERIDFTPHLSLVRAPAMPMSPAVMGQEITIASYNVHRWTGLNGRARPDAARAGFVLSELDADVIALQEVLRPFEGDDPLEQICDSLGLHLAFAATRMHKRGQLGNAILSRFPITSISVIDISHSRIERRSALAAQFHAADATVGVVATHLSLVDRTRHRQVEMLLDHPQLNSGPAVLVGDMNSWRKCRASRHLEDTLHRHNNVDWPATFPAARPMFALDRIYARGAEVLSVDVHDTRAARRASDHLPVTARVELSKGD